MAIKTVYVNGCSMTEGSELGNAKFKYNEKKNGPNTTRFDINKDPMSKEHISYMMEKCYGGQLAKLLGANCINGAAGGSSNSRIARTSLSDVVAILKSTKPEDLFVVIGWSSIQRYEHVSPNLPKAWIPRVPGIPSTGSKYDTHLEQRDLYQASSLLYTTTDYVKHILFLQMFLESNNIKYAFTSGLNIMPKKHWPEDHVAEIYTNTFIRTAFSQLDLSKWIFGQNPFHPVSSNPDIGEFMEAVCHGSFGSFSTGYNMQKHHYPVGNGSHPLEDAHEDWAKYLHTNIKDRV